MNIVGAFSTTAAAAALVDLRGPGRLDNVSGLTDVESRPDGTVRATFHATTPLGPIPLATVIKVDAVDVTGAWLQVQGRRGAQSVDVTLRLTFDAEGNGTRVSWRADVRVGGAGASVGQRVVIDLARRAISGVLEAAAAQA